MTLGLPPDDDEAGLLLLGLLHFLQQGLRLALERGGPLQRLGVVVLPLAKQQPAGSELSGHHRGVG
jgi:hypothetical protein